MYVAVKKQPIIFIFQNYRLSNQANFVLHLKISEQYVQKQYEFKSLTLFKLKLKIYLTKRRLSTIHKQPKTINLFKFDKIQ